MKTYKVYECGSGTTEIIQAENLEDAHEQAQDLIRDGEWGDDGASIEYSVTEVMPIKISYWRGENSEILVGVRTISGDDKEAGRVRRDGWTGSRLAPDGWDGGEWDDSEWSSYSYSQAEGEEDSGTCEIEPSYEKKIAEATRGEETCGTDHDDHDWTSDGEGGLSENPGVWSIGGTKMKFLSHCRCCGLHRTEISVGAQRNPDDHDTTEYRMLDEEEIEWHRKNGSMNEAAVEA